MFYLNYYNVYSYIANEGVLEKNNYFEQKWVTLVYLVNCTRYREHGRLDLNSHRYDRRYSSDIRAMGNNDPRGATTLRIGLERE